MIQIDKYQITGLDTIEDQRGVVDAVDGKLSFKYSNNNNKLFVLFKE